jgi:extradiol dioxygenase family protein
MQVIEEEEEEEGNRVATATEILFDFLGHNIHSRAVTRAPFAYQQQVGARGVVARHVSVHLNQELILLLRCEEEQFAMGELHDELSGPLEVIVAVAVHGEIVENSTCHLVARDAEGGKGDRSRHDWRLV